MNDAVNSCDQVDTIADQRTGPGIVVLSSSMQLLHMNRQAAELSTQINKAENGKEYKKIAHGVLPAALTELCAEILKVLQVRTEAKDWEQFEVKRLAGNPARPILLRGFGLPERGASSSHASSSPWKRLGADNRPVRSRPRSDFSS